MHRLLMLVPLVLTAAACTAGSAAGKMQVPPGFHVGVYSAQVPDARAMALGADGTVFVGTSGAGKVYALTDADQDGRADKVRVVASGLRNPLGIAFHDGDLYVSAVDRILVLPDIEGHLDAPPKPRVVVDDLPGLAHHSGRFIDFGPDGRLYVAIGAPCNVCDREGFAELLSMRPDGSDRRVEARGVRNSVGFDWQPGSDKLWFTDNGRDMMGDDVPGDELNRIDERGQHFGFPFCHQGDISDPRFGAGHPCSDYAAPAQVLDAHVAALGMAFYSGDMFPPDYRGDIIIAEHGSWNRSSKAGYRVMRARVAGDKVLAMEPFVTGILRGQKYSARPVDVLVLADGSVLISEDHAGTVYRVTYTPPGTQPADPP